MNNENNIDLIDVDLSLYNLFYFVCKNESFSKAARLLGLTQPSISYNIKKLEDKLGVKLFIRGNSLVLTPEAEALLPYVEEAINTIKRGESKVNDIINLKKGQISIGVPSHIGVFLLSDIIKKFNIIYPNIRIRVVCKPTKELFRLLNLNELDIVIDCSPLEENINNFVIVKFSNEKCVFACNKNFKELINRKISLNELNNYPLIVPSKTSSNTKRLMSLYESKKIPFDPEFEIMTSDMIAELTESGIGVGFLFEKTVKRYPELSIIDTVDSLPSFNVYMIYKDYLLSSTVKEFIKFMNEFKKNNI